MGRQWGVLFEARHLMLEPLEAPCCPAKSVLCKEVRSRALQSALCKGACSAKKRGEDSTQS